MEKEIIKLQEVSKIFSILNNFSPCLHSLNSGNDGYRLMMAKKFADNAEFLVLRMADKIDAGFISFYANNQEEKVAYISMIAVDKNYRNRGVGQMLLNESIAIARKKGMKCFRLEVSKENCNAITFYNKNGFFIIGEKVDGLYMEKDLIKCQ